MKRVSTFVLSLTGATGQVLMNNKAVRVPSYATYYVKNGTLKIVVELTARLGDKAKCAMSENDCSEHVSMGENKTDVNLKDTRVVELTGITKCCRKM